MFPSPGQTVFPSMQERVAVATPQMEPPALPHTMQLSSTGSAATE